MREEAVEISGEQLYNDTSPQYNDIGLSNSTATLFAILFIFSAILCFVANSCILVMVVRISRALLWTTLNCYLVVQASVNLLTVFFQVFVIASLLRGTTPGLSGCAVSVLSMDTVLIVSLFLHLFISRSLFKSLYDPLHLQHKRHRTLLLLVLVIVAAIASCFHSVLLFGKEDEGKPDLLVCFWAGQGLDTVLNATIFLVITILVAVLMACCSAIAYYKYYLAMIVRVSRAYLLDDRSVPQVLDHLSLKKICSTIRNSEVETITSYAAQLTGFLLSVFVYFLVSISASVYAIAGARQQFSPVAYLLAVLILCLFTQMPFILFFINAKLKRWVIRAFCTSVCNSRNIAFDEGESSNDNTLAVQESGVLTEYIMGMTANSYNNLLRELIVEDELTPASHRSGDSGYVHNPIPIQEAWV